MEWIERLKFYTSPMTKEQAISLARYIQFVKVKAINEEGEEIIKLIEKQVGNFESRDKEIESLKAECFHLAANQCRFPYAGEHGDPECSEINRLKAQLQKSDPQGDNCPSMELCYKQAQVLQQITDHVKQDKRLWSQEQLLKYLESLKTR